MIHLQNTTDACLTLLSYRYLKRDACNDDAHRTTGSNKHASRYVVPDVLQLSTCFVDIRFVDQMLVLSVISLLGSAK